MSDLVKHAEYEMRRAGLYDQDSDYGGMIPEAVMKLVRVHASEGHSGGSHALVIEIFTRVANFKTLTPITDDPDEWLPDRGSSKEPMWQNKRDPSFFSTDGGKTCYSINDKYRVVKPTAHLIQKVEPG